MRPTTRGRLRDRLSGLGATLLIAAFVIGMPPLLFAIDATPWHESLGDIGSLLTNPDDGTLALLVVAVVAWIAWAVMTALFALEILAFIRGVPAPRLLGLGPLQDQVGNLVAVAALLFVAAPAIAPAFAPQAAHAAPETPQQIVNPTATPLAETAAAATPVATSGPDEATTVDYTVRRGDSLWKIAQEQLGDPMRFREIVALNPDALRGRADFIDPGMVLRVPSDATPTSEETEEAPRPEETYVVESGDTLWEIADEKLGSGERYPEIFEASRDTVQPDGQRLTDPDLIRPGWKVTVPGTSADVPPISEPPIAEPPVDVEPTEPKPEPQPVEPNQPEGTDTESPDTGHDPAVDAQEDADQGLTAGAPGWLVPGLAGAGAILAAGLLTALRRAYRRTAACATERPGEDSPCRRVLDGPADRGP